MGLGLPFDFDKSKTRLKIASNVHLFRGIRVTEEGSRSSFCCGGFACKAPVNGWTKPPQRGADTFTSLCVGYSRVCVGGGGTFCHQKSPFAQHISFDTSESLM